MGLRRDKALFTIKYHSYPPHPYFVSDVYTTKSGSGKK